MEERKIRIQQEIPDNTYRPDKFLEDDNTETDEYQDKRPVDVSQCPHKLTCLSDSLKLFRNKFSSDREYLIWNARYLCKLKLNVMEEIFRLDSSNLCRVSRKAEWQLRKER